MPHDLRTVCRSNAAKFMNNTENLNINHSNAEEVIKFRAECPVGADAVRSILCLLALSIETETETLENWNAGRPYRLISSGSLFVGNFIGARDCNVRRTFA